MKTLWCYSPFYLSKSPFPGANYFYNLLERYLSGKKDGLAIDAAASNFFNRDMFKTDNYCGVDVSCAKLRNGLRKFPQDTKSFAVLADISRPLSLRNCADVCVSGYTLLYFPPKYRVMAAMNLMNTVKKGGAVLMNFPKAPGDQEIIDYAKRNFEKVRVLRYDSFLSGYFEKWAKVRPVQPHLDWRVRRENVFTGLSRLTPLWTFLFEGLYPSIIKGNRQILLICEGRKTGDVFPFPFHSLEKVEERIYREPKTPMIVRVIRNNEVEEISWIREQIGKELEAGIPIDRIAIFAPNEKLLREIRENLAPCYPMQAGESSEKDKEGISLFPYTISPVKPFDVVFFVGLEKENYQVMRPPLYSLGRIATKRVWLSLAKIRNGKPSTSAIFDL